MINWLKSKTRDWFTVKEAVAFIITTFFLREYAGEADLVVRVVVGTILFLVFLRLIKE